MASLTLTLSEPEIRAILDNDVVQIVDYDEEPDYDEGRYRICRRISDCTPGVPFQVALDEVQALADAITDLGPSAPLSDADGTTLLNVLAALDIVDD